MKKLLELHKPTNEHSEYQLKESSNGWELVYGETFSKAAQGALDGSIINTGDGYAFRLAAGYVGERRFTDLELDYGQAVTMLNLLLLTHKDYAISVVNEAEILKD